MNQLIINLNSKYLKYLALLVCCHYLTACIDVFDPPIRSEDRLEIYVDGMISDLPEPYTINVKRVKPINTPNPFAPFLNIEDATVVVEDLSGNRYQFEEGSPGEYHSDPAEFVGQAGESYRLLISTQQGVQFETDYQLLRPGTGVESIRYESTETFLVNPSGDRERIFGMQMNADVKTSGADQNDYFLFQYEGTFVVVSPLDSIYDNGLTGDSCYVVERPPIINTLSTESLNTNLVKDHPVGFLQPQKRLMVRYSFQLRQFSISKQAHEYFRNIERQRTNVGSIFDPPPAPLLGNVRRIDGERESAALGYFLVAGASTKRIEMKSTDYERFVEHWIECYPPPPVNARGDKPIPDIIPFPCYECEFLPNSTKNRPPYM